jgi:DnaK suppressor protein
MLLSSNIVRSAILMTIDTNNMRGRLESMRKEFLAQIDDLTIGEEAVTLSDPQHAGDFSDDPTDDADALFESERNLAQAEQLRGLLELVDQSLARIQSGVYGRCLSCGKPIDEKRLNTIPYAQYCLEDQVKHEQSASV